MVRICGRHGRIYTGWDKIRGYGIKIDIVTAPHQVRGEQPARETATDENKLCCHSREWLTADYADITDNQSRVEIEEHALKGVKRIMGRDRARLSSPLIVGDG